MARMRFGVVGIGYGQQVLVPAIRAVHGCEVTAIAATTGERAARAAERLSIPTALGDWRELVASEQVDAIAIAVPPTEQAEIAIAAAVKGKHLFCEKPLAATLEGATAIVEAVRAAGVVAVVDFQFTSIPIWQVARQQLRDGGIGMVRHATIVWHVETYANRNRLQSWKVNPAAGGGALLNMGPHLLHNVEWLLGPIQAVTCRLGTWPGSRVEDAGDTVATLILDLTAGGQVAATIGTNSPAGSGHRLEIYGDVGQLALVNAGSDYMDGFELSIRTRAETVAIPTDPNVSPSGGDGRIPPVTAVVSALVAAANGGVLTAPSVADGLRVQVLLDAAMRSSYELRTVEIQPSSV